MLNPIRTRGSATIATALLLTLIVGQGRVAGVASASASDLDRAAVTRLETQALDATSRGRHAEALVPLARAIELSARAAGAAAEGPQHRRDAATAEALFVLYDETVRQIDAFAEAGKTVGDWLDADWLDLPLLEARMRFARARYVTAADGSGDGWSLTDTLGFLTDWQVIGPFDNEQGSGFHRVFPPETELDFEATYSGKAREANWRRIPARVGLVPLGSLFHPATHALGYAATTLRLEQDSDVAFRLSSDESTKVWIDGTQVFEHDARRPCRFDQDAFGVRLSAGPHRILVKVAQQTGGWAFALRVTRPDGSPLAGWSIDADRAAFAETDAVVAAAENTATVETIPIDEGALATFRELLAADPDAADAMPDAAALFRRATVLFLSLVPDDPTERSAQRLATRAVELAPDDPHARFLLSRSASPPIKMRPELEENERRQHLEEVLRMDPGHARAALDLAGHYLDSIELPERSLEYCARAIAANPDSPEARIARIRALEWKGLYGLADAERKKLADGPERDNAAVLMVLAARLTRRGLLSGAIELLERASTIDRANLSVRRSLTQTLERSGRFDEALELIDAELRTRPLSLAAHTGRARILEAAGDLAGAQRALDRALEIAPQNPALWKSHGLLLHEQDMTDRALASLERARDLDPKDRWLETYLEFLMQETRPFEESFPYDIEPLLGELDSWEADADIHYRYPLYRRIIKINPDGTASRYHHLLIEARNQTGADALARFPISYRADSQRVRLRRAEVRKKSDGSTLTGELARGAANVRWVVFPALEPGDVIELQYRVDDVRPSIFGDYFGLSALMQRRDGAPVLRSRLTIITPESRDIHFRERNGLPAAEFRSGDQPDTIARVYEMRDLPRFQTEPYMPPREESWPLVDITSYGSWNEFSRWWWNLIKDEFLVNESMRELVEEIRAKAPTPLDQIREVYNYVATQIRYVAWEFGIHGYQPYNATTIFARRFGDCKDKSILMATLLDELGIESHPVLIRAAVLRGEQDLSSPLLNHFNHCILYVPGYNPRDADGDGIVESQGASSDEAAPGLFLDGTAQFNDWVSLPSSDQDARVLIVEGESSRLARTPLLPASTSHLDIDESVLVRQDGSARVTGTMTATGDAAAQMRSMYATPGNRKEQVAARFAALFGPVDVRSIEFSDLSDLDETLRYDYVVEIPEILKKAGRDATIPILFSAPTVSEFTELAERKHDLLLPTLHSWKSRVTFQIQAPLVGRLYFSDVEIDNEFGQFRRGATQDGPTIVVRGSFETRKRRIAVADYAEFRKFSRSVDQAAREVIRVR